MEEVQVEFLLAPTINIAFLFWFCLRATREAIVEKGASCPRDWRLLLLHCRSVCSSSGEF